MQIEITCDPEFRSFKVSVRSCASSKFLMNRPVQTKILCDPDFRSVNLWEKIHNPTSLKLCFFQAMKRLKKTQKKTLCWMLTKSWLYFKNIMSPSGPGTCSVWPNRKRVIHVSQNDIKSMYIDWNNIYQGIRKITISDIERQVLQFRRMVLKMSIAF